jgi:multicomponent Na+:H+ antiporter subunit E
MKSLFFYSLLFLLLLGTWLVLTLPFSREEFITGAIISFIIILVTGRTIPAAVAGGLSVKTFIYAIPFFFVFITELIKSNLDVAFRVLHPTLPINPGIVKVKTTLTSPLGRIILANAITLTPGTLTVETDNDTFYIHWINISSTDTTSATSAIVTKFEKYLGVMFG